MIIDCTHEIPKKPFVSGTIKISFIGNVDEDSASHDWKPDVIIANIECDPFNFGLSDNVKLKGRYKLKDDKWEKVNLQIIYPPLPTVATWSRDIEERQHDPEIMQLVVDALTAQWTEAVAKTILDGARKETLHELQVEMNDAEERVMELEMLIDKLDEIVNADPDTDESDEMDDD